MVRSRKRVWALAFVISLPLVFGSISTAPAGAAPSPQAQEVRPDPENFGNDPDANPGPRFGKVDPKYASPAAARETVHREHGRHNTDAAPTPSVTASAEGDVTAAGLDPAVYGSWTRTTYNLPLRAIHATLLRNGKILLISGSGNQEEVFRAGSFKAGVLDPQTGAYTAVNPPYDMFCAGHAQLPNGNILVVGGTLDYPASGAGWKGSKRIFEFDVANSKWIARTSMPKGRWYPTSISSPHGHVWNFAGDDENSNRNTTVDRYTYGTGSVVQKPAWSLPMYPGLRWTAKDRIFYDGTRSGGGAGQPGLYNPGTGAVQAVNGITNLDQRRAAASLFAGDAHNQLALVIGGGWPAVNTTSYIDLKPTTPAGKAGPNIGTAKGFVGAVNLPTDGSVFQTGGGTGRDTPVFESSVIKGTSSAPMAPNTVPRTYHSSTILLPDGRVMTMGGDDYGDGFELAVEIYSPPYLFKGTRPAITGAPTSAAYDTTFTVSGTVSGASLASAWLLRPASTTHSTDPNQRAIKLATTAVTGGLKATVPSRFIASPGYYMLFLNDSLGRPSVAKWVRIG